jgi:hypothetical protein
MAHGQKMHTFCALTWVGKSIWNRDIDKSADSEILRALSEKTATPIERVRATTLAAYEGVLYEKHNHFGPTPWIMPVGVYHRTRLRFGLQYCSKCLAEDGKPYYRRKWRLAFLVICEKHQIPLQDRCPRCNAAINFHRNELGTPRKFTATALTDCYSCGLDLRTAQLNSSSFPTVTQEEIDFTYKLLQGMTDGFIRVGGMETTYSHLYFTGLRQLMMVVATRNRRIDSLRKTVSNQYDVEIYQPPIEGRTPDIQEQGALARRQLLNIARCLLTEWPHRFVSLAKEHQLWSSSWLRHMESCPWERSQTAPFWFWRAVHDQLYRARYCPSDEEIQNAIRHLMRDGRPVSKSALSRLLGVAVIRREVL